MYMYINNFKGIKISEKKIGIVWWIKIQCCCQGQFLMVKIQYELR